MQEMDNMFLNYKYKPDIILGQFESFSSLLLWTQEVIASLSQKDFSWLEFGDKNLANLANYKLNNDIVNIKQNIFDTILLYGKLDISGGFYLFRNLLNNVGVIANNSEIFDEFLTDYSNPFANTISSFSIVFDNELLPESTEISEIHSSMVQTLISCGYPVSLNLSNKILRFLKLKFEHPKLIAIEGYSQIQVMFNYWQSIWEKSLNSNIPLFSQNLSAPIWKSDIGLNCKYEIIDILWDEIKWFPKPMNFKEAIDMSKDERIASLRNYISILSNKLAIGDFEELNDIKFEIRKEVNKFKSKSWASQISRFSTYSAIPIGVSEMLLQGTGYCGLTLSSVGLLSQAASDIVEKNKVKHWISLGQDFIKRNS